MDLAESASDHIWVAAARGYRSSDGELLSTGLLADAEVHCMKTKYVWKVHKAILCSRSEWFKKALEGKKWKEGQTGIVKINDTPQHHIELILTFLYKGYIDLTQFFDERSLWTSCMEVWKLADFFLIDELCMRALHVHDKLALEWTSTYAFHLEEGALDHIPPGFAELMVESLSALYQGEKDGLAFRNAFKPALIATAASGVLLLARQSSFTSLLREIPEFAVDWSLELTSQVCGTSSHKADFEPFRAYRCERCGKRDESWEPREPSSDSGDDGLMVL